MPRTGLNYTSNITALGFNEYPIVRTTSEIVRQERINKLAYGLVNPKNEEKLVGNPKSDINLIEDDAVIYSFTDTDGKPFEISVALDENGIHIDTPTLTNIKVQASMRLVFLVCSPVECIKSAFNVHLMPPKGFFKAKSIPDIRIHYGDEVKINPASLYDFTEPKIGDQVDGEASNSTEKKEKRKKEDL